MSWLSRFFDRRRARRIARVLAVLSDGGDHYGWPLAQATGLSAAGVYIALDHLEAKGVVVSGWADPARLGVPRRRWYRLADPSTRYTVSVFPPELHGDLNAYSYLIQVEETRPGCWAVRRSGRCLNAGGGWDWESIPSERTHEWLAEYRHDKDTALRLAAEAAPKVRVNGKTAAEMLAWVLLDAAVEPLLAEDGESR